ncbi:MAG TPA: cell wall-binding repeat-containing protein, partial [Candidatus Limnocylindria bacterium]|nr:cell wall-binding repeat-containing protein [Candidatus Limnocylindria bacterium]
VAARDRAPLLLVASDRLPVATAAELTRLQPGRIVIIGGTGTVSRAVETALGGYTSGSVTRLGGGSRYSTSLSVSRASYAAGSPTSVCLASGTTYSDALAAASSRGAAGAPVLLVRDDRATSGLLNELRRLAPSEIVIVGGSSRISDAVLDAVSDLGG